MAKRRTSWTEGESRWVGLQVVFPGFSRILPTQILLVFIFVVLCSVQKFGVRRKDDFGDGAIRYFFLSGRSSMHIWADVSSVFNLNMFV